MIKGTMVCGQVGDSPHKMLSHIPVHTFNADSLMALLFDFAVIKEISSYKLQ